MRLGGEGHVEPVDVGQLIGKFSIIFLMHQIFLVFFKNAILVKPFQYMTIKFSQCQFFLNKDSCYFKLTTRRKYFKIQSLAVSMIKYICKYSACLRRLDLLEKAGQKNIFLFILSQAIEISNKYFYSLLFSLKFCVFTRFHPLDKLTILSFT